MSSYFPSINEQNISSIYQKSAITFSIAKDKAVLTLTRLWHATVRISSEQTTNLTNLAATVWKAVQTESQKLVHEISQIPAKMQTSENTALAVIATCNAVFIFVIDAALNAINHQLKRTSSPRSRKSKKLA